MSLLVASASLKRTFILFGKEISILRSSTCCPALNYNIFKARRFYSTQSDKSSKNLAKVKEAGDKSEEKFPPPPKYQISPIRKLLRVKDYVDLVFFLLLSFGIYYGYKKYQEKKKTEKQFTIEWITLPKFKNKCFKSNGYILSDHFAKNLNNFKEFKHRKGDIWICSFPKSG